MVCGSKDKRLCMEGCFSEGRPLTPTRGESQRAYGRAPWKELFSEEGQRYYYADPASSETSWDAPLHFRANEWLLDTSAYGVDLPTARRIYEAVDAVMGERRAAEWKPVAELLIKVIRPCTHADNSLSGGNTQSWLVMSALPSASQVLAPEW